MTAASFSETAKPLVLVNDSAEFTEWLSNAQPGDRAMYYIDFLCRDRVLAPNLDHFAETVMRACEQGLVHLAQRRLDLKMYSYYAIKSHPSAKERQRKSPHSELLETT